MKTAVIGSGPAALAALYAMREHSPQPEVTVFDAGQRPVFVESPPATDPADLEYLKGLYRNLRRSHGLCFPPPKTVYGYSPDQYVVNGKKRVWKSRLRGGLSNIWGGSVLPFSERELRDWPLTIGDLDSYYEKIAGVIGISGTPDDLEAYFGTTYITRPSRALSGQMAALLDAAGAGHPGNGIQLLAGTARLALETRRDHDRRCIACGGCMTGCSRASLFSTLDDISAFRRTGLIDHYVEARVLSVDPRAGSLRISTDGGETTVSGFDKIFLAAGCVGSTEILMRSFGIADGVEIADNAVYSFPIIFSRARLPENATAVREFVLTNLVLGLADQARASALTQIQIYPSFEHLWRYYLPSWSWPTADYLGRVFKKRLFWARLYLPSDHSARYAASMDRNGNFSLGLAREHAPSSQILPMVDALREALGGSGFFVPRMPPISHATSSHYGASFPYHAQPLNIPKSGEAISGLYICDASVFSSLPSLSPTFTIMANAWRTSANGLQD